MIRTRYNVVVPRGETYLTMHLVYNLARCPYPIWVKHQFSNMWSKSFLTYRFAPIAWNIDFDWERKGLAGVPLLTQADSEKENLIWITSSHAIIAAERSIERWLMKKKADTLWKGTMGLVISIFAALFYYAAMISAAPPSVTTPYLLPLQSISQLNNYTMLFRNITAGYADTQIPIWSLKIESW